MWRLLLPLLAVCATGFQFPDEQPVTVETTTEDYPDYGPPVDPGTEELEERFFFRGSKRVAGNIGKKLGHAATSFFNTLSSRGDGPARRTESTDISGSPDYGGSSDYNDYEPPAPEPPSHGFPVDNFGSIDCSRVSRRRKKLCRQARRQTRRRGRRPTLPGGGRNSNIDLVSNCAGGPDTQTMTQAQDSCCALQQKGDLFSFNNCCQTFGFCPTCKVDSNKLAQDECCPLQYDDDQLGYRRCCSKYGMCPLCEAPPTVKPAGCMYKGKMFATDSVMDKLAYKCMFVRCKDNGNGPETVLEFLDQVGCCEKDKDLFPPGRSIQVDECTNRVCEDGEWVETNSDLAAVFASPCPEGWMDLGGSCVYIWQELMTWTNASAACGKLLGTLALPQNKAQLTQLINAIKNIEGRDSSRELGGWMNARDTGRQWQTPQGDTLTFAPWEEGSPDRQRRTACAGLTVTDRSQGWKDYLCGSRQNMLYPICQVAKPACGATAGGCGPYEGDMMFTPSSGISLFSNDCEAFRCNDNSYVVREVNPQCCYNHEWNGRAFGRAQGWYAGLYPSGGFQPYEGLLCECVDGVGDCTQFFDH